MVVLKMSSSPSQVVVGRGRLPLSTDLGLDRERRDGLVRAARVGHGVLQVLGRAADLRRERASLKTYSPKIGFNRRTLYRKTQKISISSPKLASPIKLGLALSRAPATDGERLARPVRARLEVVAVAGGGVRARLRARACEDGLALGRGVEVGAGDRSAQQRVRGVGPRGRLLARRHEQHVVGVVPSPGRVCQYV